MSVNDSCATHPDVARLFSPLTDELKAWMRAECQEGTCRNKHPWTTESTYWNQAGYLVCRLCAREKYRANRRRRSAA